MKINALTASLHDVLDQGLLLLRTVDEITFRTVAETPYLASIGQHYRHILDHFICLADGIMTGTINYDQRTRDRQVESSRELAREKTEELRETFWSLNSTDLSSPCKILYTIGYSNDEAQEIETVLVREIAFCVSHAIHHFAIIRLVCAHFSVALPEEFGVAPSTLKYRAAQVST